MPNVPAICNTCGTIFNSGIFFDGPIEAGFFNVSCGPCPACGSDGHIPDGIFVFIDDTIKLLSGSLKTIDELKKIELKIRTLIKRENDYEKVTKTINEEVPELSLITNFLPKDAKDLCAYLGIVLSIIMLFINAAGSGKQKKIEMHQVINYIYQNQTININKK